MGLNNLETKIRENKAFFEEEPTPEHFDRFEAKLNTINYSKPANKSYLFTSKRIFAYAATVSILLLVSLFAILESSSLNAQPQLSEELFHVKMYYSQLTGDKISEIEKCTKTINNDFIYESTSNRLLKLDESTLELEQKLSRAQGNKQLESAYIQSLKAKSEIVDQIYAQMCVDNTNNLITQ